MTRTYHINATEEFHKKFAELVEQFNTPEKDYEVQSLTGIDNLGINIFIDYYQDLYKSRDKWVEFFLASKQWKIHSIKRLSDGEIFTLGDQVALNKEWETSNCIIKSFKIGENGKLEIIIKENEDEGSYDLGRGFYKVQKKPVLFLTEDGKEVHEGDVVYTVSIFSVTPQYLGGNKAENDWIRPTPHLKDFSSESKALEYFETIKSKPLFTTVDGVDIYEGDTFYYYSTYNGLTKEVATEHRKVELDHIKEKCYSSEEVFEKYKPRYSSKQILDAIEELGSYGVLINKNILKEKLGI
jgi:hypothetical protein